MAVNKKSRVRKALVNMIKAKVNALKAENAEFEKIKVK
jgi:hypothetical protein